MNNGQPQQSKKVLIVAYHFAPDAAVGALRPQKFVKYLPEFGWQPYVLTIQDRFIEKMDSERLKDVENVEIVRTDFWRTPLQYLIDFRDVRRGGFEYGPKNAQVAASPVLTGEGGRKSLLGTLRKILLSLNWLPDDKLYWAIPAVIAGYRLIKREKIGCIFASAPPHTVGIIGMLLAKLTGARLVLDMRDPWTLCRKLSEKMANAFYNDLNAYLEKKVMDTADRILVTTNRYAVNLRVAYQNDKIIVIPNGYDGEDFESLSRRRNNELYVITYLGTFYLDRSPQATLMAVRQLIDDGVIDQNMIQLRFIGNVQSVGSRSVESIVAECGLTDTVVLKNMIPYPEALQEMVNADVLLLLAPNQPYQIPAKAFEYIGAQRPILALTEDGATADLINSAGVGIAVTADDVLGIKSAIAEFYQKRNDERYYANSECGDGFTRRELTRQLAVVLESIV